MSTLALILMAIGCVTVGVVAIACITLVASLRAISNRQRRVINKGMREQR
jgi:hypothetical protein